MADPATLRPGRLEVGCAQKTYGPSPGPAAAAGRVGLAAGGGRFRWVRSLLGATDLRSSIIPPERPPHLRSPGGATDGNPDPAHGPIGPVQTGWRGTGVEVGSGGHPVDPTKIVDAWTHHHDQVTGGPQSAEGARWRRPGGGRCWPDVLFGGGRVDDLSPKPRGVDQFPERSACGIARHRRGAQRGETSRACARASGVASVRCAPSAGHALRTRVRGRSLPITATVPRATAHGVCARRATGRWSRGVPRRPKAPVRGRP